MAIKVILLKGPKRNKLGTHQFCLLILNTARTSSIQCAILHFLVKMIEHRPAYKRGQNPDECVLNNQLKSLVT